MTEGLKFKITDADTWAEQNQSEELRSLAQVTDLELLATGHKPLPEHSQYEFTPYSLAEYTLHLAAVKKLELPEKGSLVQKTDFAVAYDLADDDFCLLTVSETKSGKTIRSYPLGEGFKDTLIILSEVAWYRRRYN